MFAGLVRRFKEQALILLCYLRSVPHSGQHGSRPASTVATRIRRVAIECGLWRCARPAWLPVGWNFGSGKLELSSARRGGKTASFRYQKAVGGNAKCGVMMESAPTSPLIVPQAKLLLEFFVIRKRPVSTV